MPLVLDLLRHGAAQPDATGGDRARPLSPRGRADMELLAAHLAGMGWRPDRAFASPFLRARDSAVIALHKAAPGLTVELMDALCPEADPAGVLQALAAAGATAGHLFLVGHQPLLGMLGGALTGGPAPGFAPGSLLRIKFAGTLSAGGGILGWRIPPGVTG